MILNKIRKNKTIRYYIIRNKDNTSMYILVDELLHNKMDHLLLKDPKVLLDDAALHVD